MGSEDRGWGRWALGQHQAQGLDQQEGEGSVLSVMTSLMPSFGRYHIGQEVI